jgi:hypothetical protein
MSTKSQLSYDEHQELPFEFTNGCWETQLDSLPDIVIATWLSKPVWSCLPSGPFYFNVEGNPEVSTNDWNQAYPNFHKVKPASYTNTELLGTYQSKLVCWSHSQHHWQYLNHHPITFKPTPPESTPTTPRHSSAPSHNSDVEEVSALLESAASTLTRTVASLTPEQ